MNASQYIEHFQQAIQTIDPQISREALSFLVSGTSIKKIKGRAMFITPEKKHEYIGFVGKGLLRGYYIDAQGQEITTRLVKEGNFATHYKAFLMQCPSKYYFQGLEDSCLVCFSYGHIQQGYARYPSLERFGRLVAEQIIKVLEYRMESFQFMTAEERYLDFVANNAELLNRITLTHLASYLGIQRPSLSRIRKRLASR